MSNLLTFESGDHRFRFTVKDDFLKRCPTPETIDVYELMTKYKLNQSLHNPKGPAITRLKDNHSEYWMDGQMVPKEVAEKMIHNNDFATKLLTEIE